MSIHLVLPHLFTLLCFTVGNTIHFVVLIGLKLGIVDIISADPTKELEGSTRKTTSSRQSSVMEKLLNHNNGVFFPPI